MGFWSGLFGGSNPTLNQDIGNVGANAGFASQKGQSDISQASDFESAILSGDMSKISKVLAPQISGIQKRAQQKKQTNAQFGDRSGGTNAENQMIGDNATSDVNKMISDLTGSAATNLGEMGKGLLAQGEAGYMDQAHLSQVRMENWMKSILGQATGEAAGAATSAGLGEIGL
jgi:hypothetical protein